MANCRALARRGFATTAKFEKLLEETTAKLIAAVMYGFGRGAPLPIMRRATSVGPAMPRHVRRYEAE